MIKPCNRESELSSATYEQGHRAMIPRLSLLVLMLQLLIGCVQRSPTGKIALSFQEETRRVELKEPVKPEGSKSSSSIFPEQKGDSLDTPVHIELILDVSGSPVAGDKGRTKIGEAKRTALKVIEEMNRRFQNPTFGLRVYGSQFPRGRKNCRDTKLIVPLRKADLATLRRKIQSITTRGGMAPITLSIRKAKEDLETLQGRKLIILITDGKEACGGNLCQVVSQAMASGVEKPLIYLIGHLPGDKSRQQLECIASLPKDRSSTAKRVQESDKGPERAPRTRPRSPTALYIYTLYNVKNQVIARQSLRTGRVVLHNLPPGRYQLQIETEPKNRPGFPVMKEIYVQENRVAAIQVKGNQVSLSYVPAVDGPDARRF